MSIAEGLDGSGAGTHEAETHLCACATLNTLEPSQQPLHAVDHCKEYLPHQGESQCRCDKRLHNADMYVQTQPFLLTSVVKSSIQTA